MNTREFITGMVISSILGLTWACDQQTNEAEFADGKIMTINGLIPVDSLGVTLIHEHVFLDWSGANQIDTSLWNEEEALGVILPYLTEMKERGVKSFLECTPAYLGRNPYLLLRLSKATGLQIITNTGFYAAREHQHLPDFVNDYTDEEIAAIWVKEFTEGIEGSPVKPGFIKIGVDSKTQLDSIDQKIVRAAALTHLATGLTIVGHTGTDTTAAQQVEILERAGVTGDAFVWTHAQRGTGPGHVRMAKKGVWISLDGLGWVEPDEANADSSALMNYVEMLKNLQENDLLHKTLISHDAGWYTVGASDQSHFQPYTAIFEVLIPILLQNEFTTDHIEILLVDNPKQAYAIRRRI